MKANPGGRIAPSDVIGRDELIANLWRVIDRQSVVLTAERRMGKTSIITKMKAEVPSGKTAYFRDLEQVHRPVEFAELVFADVENALSVRKKFAIRARRLVSEISGAEFHGFKFPDIAGTHWKQLLYETLSDLAEGQSNNTVFFWDELPWMLENVKRGSGEPAAMELLDSLRGLRQMHPGLRMVFTGSVGLHHVLTSLRKAGYGNTPTNDMYVFDVPPLSGEGGVELVHRLILGEGLKCENIDESAKEIASAVSNIPFYIQHVIDQFSVRQLPATRKSAELVITDALTSGQDPWDLRHFRERIDRYYGADGLVVVAILDAVALAKTPLVVDDIVNAVRAVFRKVRKGGVSDLVTLLEADHYLIRKPDGKLTFKLPLIQRWWRLQSGRKI